MKWAMRCSALFWSGLAAWAWRPLPHLAGGLAVLAAGAWVALGVAEWATARGRRNARRVFTAEEKSFLAGRLPGKSLERWPSDLPREGR